MGRIFSGKTAKDTESAAESLIDPALAGYLPKRSSRFSSRLTVTEQQKEPPQIEDSNEKKSRQG
jgi:hypothetical protein